MVIPRRSNLREEFRAVATILNRSDRSISLNLQPLRSASIALKVVGPDGSPVLLPPPPIPRDPPELEVLEPGEHYADEFPNFVPQWTPVGLHRVRMVYEYHGDQAVQWGGKEVSDWTEFEVAD